MTITPILVRTIFKSANLKLAQQDDGEVSDKLWLVSFMGFDPGYFDEEACRD